MTSLNIKEQYIFSSVCILRAHITLDKSFASTKDDTINRYKAPKDQEERCAEGASSGLKSITGIGLLKPKFYWFFTSCNDLE